MTHDARFDDHAARGCLKRPRQRSGTAPPEPRTAPDGTALAEATPGMAGFLGGLHDLAEEALRLAAPSSVTDASWPDAEFVVMRGHRDVFRGLRTGDGSWTIEIVSVFGNSAALTNCRAALKTQYNQPHAPRPTAVLLSCRPSLVSPSSPGLPTVNALIHDRLRQHAITIITADLRRADARIGLRTAVPGPTHRRWGGPISDDSAARRASRFRRRT